MSELLNGIFECLDINSCTGLATEDNMQSMSPFQRLFYTQVHEKIGIDAVYFLRDANGVAKIPLIYFSVIQKYDAKQVAELHRLSWNLGEAPLLFVVTPDEILIYNNYKAPQSVDGRDLDPTVGIIETLSLADGLASQRITLQKYHRSLLECGEFWRQSKTRFNTQGRVDTTLMSNLRIMRRTLIKQISKRCDESKETITSVVHALLSRSIFVKYLEERKDSNGETVFPKGFYSNFLASAKEYTDVLNSKEATYSLFSLLKEKFNGDTLQVTEVETKIITQKDLDELRTFILGDSELESKQLALWPLYSFDIIPIQLISSIYELFFHLSDEDDEKGTYYTPLHLVNLVMDEVYPWEGTYKNITFFDPSCGSGIFLVEAYRRLVCRWMSQNDAHTITCDQLKFLLENSIFGVDINEEAIRVASFSLSLAMCDFLDPRSIWDKLSFPRLLENNLITGDFFDEDKSFNKRKYDVIIGNPPWQSSVTGKAKMYLKKSDRVIGDKQIAQAFSIKCSELCKQNGIICLLMPSKGLLFNRSDKSRTYRKNLFENNNVLAIINLSIYRKFLFDHASGPAAAIIYTPRNEENYQPIVYCTPKPIYTVEDFRKFSVDPTDICRIPRDIIDDDRIWKIAMWGAPRDLELIGKMQSTFAPMAFFIEENHMVTAEGFKRGNKKHLCDDFIGFPLVEARSFVPYYVESDDLSAVDFNDFECIVKNAREIFAAPHLIIKQSHKNGVFLSEVLDYDAVFNHSLLGIHGEISKLKYLSVVIGSRVFSYYHILTNRKWLVERDELEAGDIWQTPIPCPNDEELAEACDIFDGLVISPTVKQKAEKFVRQIYRLKEYEGYQIDDVIDYAYDYFKNKQRSVAFKRPSTDVYKLYYYSINEVLTNTFGAGANISGDLYFGDAPLSVLILNIGQQTAKELNIIASNDQLNEILLSLDNSLVDSQKMVFVRRNLRIYQRDKIYIVKPSQRKYWTYSAACRDADEIFEDVSKAWR
jgi:type I restriction-modification system DNA methylase subunit